MERDRLNIVISKRLMTVVFWHEISEGKVEVDFSLTSLSAVTDCFQTWDTHVVQTSDGGLEGKWRMSSSIIMFM